MIDPTPFPPPPSDAHQMVGPERDTKPERFARPVALFAVAAGVSIGIATVLGSAIGWAMSSASASSCTPSDGWCGLGAALVGLAVGVTVGVVAYITSGIITITRHQPPGRRAAHVVAHVAFPFAMIAILTILGALTELIT